MVVRVAGLNSVMRKECDTARQHLPATKPIEVAVSKRPKAFDCRARLPSDAGARDGNHEIGGIPNRHSSRASPST